MPGIDLEHFVENPAWKSDSNIANAIALYCIASKNLASQYQRLNMCRAGVAGSREQANIDRSATASGAKMHHRRLHRAEVCNNAA